MAAFAYLIGHDMAFGSSRLRRLVLAGQMHDIGKIGLPPYILTKPGKLTDEEWAAIKLHPAKGWEIVGRAKALKDIASIVRHHHERFDGSGYPDGLAGDDIPLEARIISVADSFDALTSERAYRPVMSIADAEGELGRSVVVRGFQGHGQVIGTKRQEDALDLEAHPLGRLASLIAVLQWIEIFH